MTLAHQDVFEPYYDGKSGYKSNTSKKPDDFWQKKSAERETADEKSPVSDDKSRHPDQAQ
ncbi:hypothetical protein ABFT80_18750 [Mesorhizobium sp. SB112]|uniref:hypothetical protein n=1 Tax=Mesorhizobium sp. SB112 TaxID=3151853 RepID=UPI0032675789